VRIDLIFQQFHEIAYKADERKELLSAINDFLDCSIVLPPGDWENQALLPFDELKAKNEAIKRRKNNKILLNDEAHKGRPENLFHSWILLLFNST